MSCLICSVSTIYHHFLSCLVLSDKPWITEDYNKRDISQRQHYLKVGDTVNFNRLRNIVNRKTKSLRSLHYKHKVRSLNSENSRSWFKQTKELIGLKSSNEDVFIPLADELCDGDMTKLANNIYILSFSFSPSDTIRQGRPPT